MTVGDDIRFCQLQSGCSQSAGPGCFGEIDGWANRKHQQIMDMPNGKIEQLRFDRSTGVQERADIIPKKFESASISGYRMHQSIVNTNDGRFEDIIAFEEPAT